MSKLSTCLALKSPSGCRVSHDVKVSRLEPPFLKTSPPTGLSFWRGLGEMAFTGDPSSLTRDIMFTFRLICRCREIHVKIWVFAHWVRPLLQALDDSMKEEVCSLPVDTETCDWKEMSGMCEASESIVLTYQWQRRVLGQIQARHSVVILS